MLSMSLVARLSTSPRGCLSKYDSGSRDSFASTSSRSRYTVRLIDPVRPAASPPASAARRPAYTASATSSTSPDRAEVDALARA